MKMQLISNPHYQSLMSEARKISTVPLKKLIKQKNRENNFCFSLDGLWVDISRHHINKTIFDKLIRLANAASIQDKFSMLNKGEHINRTENRPVLHTKLRQPNWRKTDEWLKIVSFSEKLRASQNIKTIINIGIGGSDLGPAMVTNALRTFHGRQKIRFVSNVDPSDLNDCLEDCEANTTFFLVTSKTFTTAETLQNASLVLNWLRQANIEPSKHMAAITASPNKALKWGISEEHIFNFADGVGGRYSLWSAVGLPVMIAIGKENFVSLLDGANQIDNHVFYTPNNKNLAIILALLRIWNRNFLNIPMHGIMPYDQRLAYLPAWAQQLEMESNGKSVDIRGDPLALPASPLIWGEIGTNAQHSFFQYLHQGTEKQSLDILIPRNSLGTSLFDGWRESHKTLVYNALAQAEALAIGEDNFKEPHRNFPGERVSTIISWNKTNPFEIGRLLALYEHITIASGFLWDINSFDQWGVELGKKTAKALEKPFSYNNLSHAAKRFFSLRDAKD